MIDAHKLQKYSLFGGLLEEQIDQFLPQMEQKQYEAGTRIITEGQRNDKIYFILEGAIAVVKNEVVLSELKEGDVFGEMEVIEIMPSATDIVTLVQSTVMSISNRCLRDIYRSDVKAYALIIMNLARDLSRRLRRMDERAAAKHA